MRRGLACSIALLWLLSLVLPALRINDSDNPGYVYLLWGVLGLLLGYVEWLANPLVVAAVIVLWLDDTPRIIRRIMAISLTFLVMLSLSRHGLPTDEGGMPRMIEGRLVGYGAWLGSILLAGLGLFPWRAQNR